MSAQLAICAIVATRNEAPYLRYLLPRLADQQIDLLLIDNGSTDESLDLAQAYRDCPVIGVHHLPYRGYFSLKEQLQAKQALMAGCHHHWIIHQDADEVLEHREPGRTLREAIEEAEQLGYGVLNFDEFCFLPEPDQNCVGQDYYQAMRRYYFFAPTTPRLMRAWSTALPCENITGGGHTLTAPTQLPVFPQSHNLRHYPILSQCHAWQKYLTRAFSEQELAANWHRARAQLTAAELILPRTAPYFARIEPVATGHPKPLSRAMPVRSHFWHWKGSLTARSSLGITMPLRPLLRPVC